MLEFTGVPTAFYLSVISQLSNVERSSVLTLRVMSHNSIMSKAPETIHLKTDYPESLMNSVNQSA